MANGIIAAPNHIDSTYETVIISGGNWTSSLPLSNLQNEFLSKVARSSGVTLADTKFNVDLGFTRKDIRVQAIPAHTMSRSAKVRYRATDTIAWDGATVGAAAGTTATSITVSASAAGSITITSGDTFTIAGDDTVYITSTTVTIPASGSDTITLEQDVANTGGLAVAVSGGEAITCRVGDYGSSVFDSGWLDVVSVIYPFGELPWGHPAVYDGKMTEEVYQSIQMPSQNVSDVVLARYWLIEVDDTTNSAGYVDLSRLFLATGYQPTYNWSYGATINWESTTDVNETDGKARIYNRRPPRRRVRVAVEQVTVDEALTNGLDLQQLADISEQIYFIFDPDDTVHLHRRSFLCTMSSLQPISYPFFNANNMNFDFIEVVA